MVFSINKLGLLCGLLFIGCVGKSAQIGLHTWLVAAMEGPTPVSALLHAATMVTAGVFFALRCSFLFEYIPIMLVVITFVGSFTALFASLAAVFQNDIKKVIACSTCSQLGYMFISCGLSQYSASLYHLVGHAFFKALLFLSAGFIIHGLCKEQDLRSMGGLVRLMPFIYSVVLIGTLSLIGFPFLSGFYSKDLILELALFSDYYSYSGVAYLFGTVAVFFTSLYSFRLIYLTFFVRPNEYVGYI